MQIPAFTPKTTLVGKYFFLIAALAFLLSALAGLLASIHIGIDSSHLNWVNHLRMQVLRPLHTMLSIVAMLAGAMGITISLLRSIASAEDKSIQSCALISLIAFSVLATASLSMGHTTGREYISWPPILGILLISSILLITYSVVQHFKLLAQASPEGTWLLMLGWLLTGLGFIETHGFLIPFIFNNGVRDLTVQWHGIDTVIAGINILLYAGMIFVLQQRPKLLRKHWFFLIAGFGLLGTFGHHHYASPQPGYLKLFAFAASMVAILSFIRHIISYQIKQIKQQNEPHPAMPLLLSAEYWTIIAVGSGILFAIPQINFYVHGTYLIVVHAMGSMIGINFMITIAAALLFMDYNPDHSKSAIKWGVRITNLALTFLWIGLAIPGIMKGVLRTHQSYQQFFPKIEPWLILFPICGILLFAGIFILTSEVIWLVFNHEKQPTHIE